MIKTTKKNGRLLIQYGIQLLLAYVVVPVLAQPPQCQPDKVLSPESCAKCHGSEVATWRQTPHSQTFESLVRNPRAKEITDRLGLASIKRNEMCINCHFTTRQQEDGAIRAIAGVSCESCHGASSDWIHIHNDFGGPGVTHETESDSHRLRRLEKSLELGMRNTQNLYLIATSCLNCHTVPQEELVNVGGHQAGSDDFELVSWSQGRVRHNFVRSGGLRNLESTPERLRVMYVTGLLADLEYSTRATAKATSSSTYGLAVASRAARNAARLMEVQQLIREPMLQEALVVFSAAELRTNNSAQLEAIADRLSHLGQRFAQTCDGSGLSAIDPLIPPPSTWK